MATRRRRQGAVALGLTAILALFAVGAPMSGPEREVGTPSEDRSVAVTAVLLGVGVDEAERRLAWSSEDPAVRCVEYAPAPGDATVVTGLPDSAEVAAHASGAADEQPGRIWFQAVLPGLQPATEYTYRIGNCVTAWSEPFEFRTPDPGPFSFLFLGDPQLYATRGAVDPSAGWAATLENATRRFPDTDFLMTAGDQVQSAVPGVQAAEWDLFLAPPQVRRYPLATAIGNHDEADGSGTQYGQHVAPPNVGTSGETVEGSGDYWFTHNGALFILLNSNSLDVAEHEEFMEAAQASSPSARWTVVTFHHSLFSAASHREDVEILELRENLAPILSDLGVDLVLGGHDHSYARSFLMDGTEPIPESGGATVTAEEGQVLYVTANSASGSRFYDLGSDLPWIAVADQEDVPNYTRVTLDEDAITVTTYRATDGNVVDRVTLRQAAG